MSMDPFARKMWRASLGFAALMLSLMAALTVIYVHERPRCPDRVVAERLSPDGKWTAAIVERRCGPEAPFFSRVNLRPAGPLQRGFFSGRAATGTVFVVEQDAAGSGISVVWSAPDELLVRCAHCSPRFVHQRDQQWNKVTVRYELP
jgi:hypothetical protein